MSLADNWIVDWEEDDEEVVIEAEPCLPALRRNVIFGDDVGPAVS